MLKIKTVIFGSISLKSFLRALFVLTLLFFPLFAQSQSVPQQIIFEGLTGNELLDSLAVHYKPNSVLNYNDARDVMFTQIYNVDNTVVCVFTGDVIPISSNSATPRADALNQGWNTEHVWPQSKGAGRGNARSDLHHLRPIRADVNSSRGNFPFTFLEPNEVNRWWKGNTNQFTTPSGNLGLWSKTGSGRFEVRDEEKGNVARSKFYFFAIYRDEALNADQTFFYQQMDDLRSYHNQDAVDYLEYTRTLEIAGFQSGMVNPFIIDTTLVRRAFFEDYEFDFPTNPDNPGDGDGYFINFESLTKGAYTSGNVLIGSREWNLNNVLIGTDDRDMKFDDRSARFRHNTNLDATMSLLSDFAQGIESVSFWASRSAFSGDRSPEAPILVLEYSLDEGQTWQQVGSPINLDGINVLTFYEFELNIEEPARVRIRSVSGSNGRRFNVDNISIIPTEEIVTVSQTYQAGWNLVGIPVEMEHANFIEVFDKSIPETLFGFNDGYINQSVLNQAKGYWLMFSEQTTTRFEGESYDQLEIPVNNGWNLITVNENPIPIANLLDINSSLRNGMFWKYENGYSLVDELKPGTGYWVEATQAGLLEYLNTPTLLEEKVIDNEISHTLHFSTNDGFTQELHVIPSLSEDEIVGTFPPLPPSGINDIRFENHSTISSVKSNTILFQQTEDTPIDLTFLSDKGNQMIVLDLWSETGLIGTTSVNLDHSYTLPNNVTSATFSIVDVESSEIPDHFVLHQNYPNPFNPSTTISYSLPIDDDIRLQIFNIQGQLISTLHNGNQKAGFHSVSFDAGHLASGIYILRLQTSKHILTRKMTLIK